MLPREILSKIRRIEITTSRLVTDVFAGQYHSVFKGQGMEFDEVREYFPGDDIRSIDWNVTARTGTPHVKKYVEERELTVMLLVDASMSCHFASHRQLKKHLAAEMAAVLAFSAIRNNDKVGLIFFTDRIEKFIPPRKGTKNVLRLIREILYFQPQGTQTDLTDALQFLTKVTTRRAVVFLISDFIESRPGSLTRDEEPSYTKALTLVNKRHDVIAVTLVDPRDMELPDCGLLSLRDAETGQEFVVDSSSRLIREQYRQNFFQRAAGRNRFMRRIGVDHIDVSTAEPYARELVRFFVKRKKRFR